MRSQLNFTPVYPFTYTQSTHTTLSHDLPQAVFAPTPLHRHRITCGMEVSRCTISLPHPHHVSHRHHRRRLIVFRARAALEKAYRAAALCKENGIRGGERSDLYACVLPCNGVCFLYSLLKYEEKLMMI